MKACIYGVIALAVVATYGGMYIKGRTDGKASVHARLAADKIRILKDGKVIDHEVFSADDNALCDLIGGCEVSNGGD